MNEQLFYGNAPSKRRERPWPTHGHGDMLGAGLHPTEMRTYTRYCQTTRVFIRVRFKDSDIPTYQLVIFVAGTDLFFNTRVWLVMLDTSRVNMYTATCSRDCLFDPLTFCLQLRKMVIVARNKTDPRTCPASTRWSYIRTNMRHACMTQLLGPNRFHTHTDTRNIAAACIWTLIAARVESSKAD